MKLVYDEIIKLHAPLDKIEVLSFEMNVYLLRVTMGDNTSMLYDNTDSLMRFTSTQHIREAFQDIAVKEAVLVHQSFFDEMIGNPARAPEPMQLPFTMAMPY